MKKKANDYMHSKLTVHK